MIDTHAHILSEYYENIDEEINNVFTINKIVVNSGCDELSNKEVVELTRKHPSLYASVGIHPNEDGSFDLVEQLAKDDKVIAIGETGLDYSYPPVDKRYQEELFIKHLELARKLDKPIIVHSRDATADTIKILKKYPEVKGIIHCFTGSLETAKEYITLGYKLGIGGVVTFKNSKLKEVLKEISLHNIVLETDCPYLTPEPLRGQQNHSHYIKYIYQYVADLYHVTVETLEKEIHGNVVQIFDKLPEIS